MGKRTASQAGRNRGLLLGLTFVLLTSVFSLPASASTGELDLSFGLGGKVLTDLRGFSDIANGAAVQPDGKIVVVGSGFAVVRYNPDGTLDRTFGGDGKVLTNFGGEAIARAVVVQGDGRLVVVGSTFAPDHLVIAVARYHSDGSLDRSFGSRGRIVTDIDGTDSEARSVALDAAGRIVVGGSAHGLSDLAVLRYDSNGSLDPRFGKRGVAITDLGGFEVGRAVLVQRNGRIVLAGSANGLMDFALVRYLADGRLDPEFGLAGAVVTDLGGNDGINGAVLQADGRIVVAGFSNTAGHTSDTFDFALARYRSDGSLDPSFGSQGTVLTDFGGVDSARGVVVERDGTIAAAGFTTRGPAGGRFAVAAYHADGALDKAFGGDGRVITDFGGQSQEARGLVLQPDGRIVAVGMSDATGTDDFAVARYLMPGVAAGG